MRVSGVPGVIPARFKEANQIKHCALSLVGEPIMCVRSLAAMAVAQREGSSLTLPLDWGSYASRLGQLCLWIGAAMPLDYNQPHPRPT
jgi:hypothetical protein